MIDTMSLSRVSFISCPAVLRADLLGGEGAAERADGLGVLRGLLLDLQQLSGLDDGLQSGCSFALVQVVCSQPLLHLTGVVPEHRNRNASELTHEPRMSCRL